MFGHPEPVAALGGDAQRRFRGHLPVRSVRPSRRRGRRGRRVGGEHGGHEDVGEQVVVARGDADADVGIDGFVDLRCASDPAQAGGRLRAGLQHARVDQLVQVEGGEFAGDPDRGGGLVAGDRSVRGPDEVVHAAPQLVVQHGHRLIAGSTCTRPR